MATKVPFVSASHCFLSWQLDMQSCWGDCSRLGLLESIDLGIVWALPGVRELVEQMFLVEL